MSIRITIIAICDVCQAEQEIKASLPPDSAQWDEQLRMEGWWSRPDFDEICPKHPQPTGVRFGGVA